MSRERSTIVLVGALALCMVESRLVAAQNQHALSPDRIVAASDSVVRSIRGWRPAM